MPKPIDLTGKKFGRLTVIERAKNSADGRAKWRCICDCGNERIVYGKCLRNGHTQSCGCLNKEVNSKRSLIDRTGQHFGRLTVISRASDYVAPNGDHHVMWLCQCSCGNTTIVDTGALVKGHTKSCGCLHRENLSRGNKTHGGCHDRLYKVYYNMKNRCLNANSQDYKYYGGRGITICNEWLKDYVAFRQWAYSSGYDKDAEHGKCTLDRIDVNGNYEPNNCRWVDMATQCRNRRNVIQKHNDNNPRENKNTTITKSSAVTA